MLVSRSVRSLVLVLCLFGAGIPAGTAQQSAFAGPLRVHPTNKRYFTDNSGKPIYLTGSHVWNNFKDSGRSDPPPVFNWPGYLDLLTQHKHNFIRLWTWEPFWEDGVEPTRYTTPHPWPRVGPGNALDGKPKFNLNQLNQAYFDRLRTRVVQARDRGIYVSIMLFEGCSVRYDWFGHGVSWRGNPFNPSNNVNGINGDPNGDGWGIEILTLTIPAITNIQKAYIRKVIDTVNDLDNVLYEICNEGSANSKSWQTDLCNHIKGYEAGKPKRHPVGITDMYSNNDQFSPFPAGTDQDLFNSPADWIAIRNGEKVDPPVATGAKVILLDTDHLGAAMIAASKGHRWVWKSFTRGHNPIVMDTYSVGNMWTDPWFQQNMANLNYTPVRNAMGRARQYANRVDLAGMIPRGDLTSTGYALAKPGSEYLVLAINGGAFTVNLAAGTYAFEWFNPVNGTVSGTGSITAAAGSRSFAAPFSGDAVLYLKAGTAPPPPPGDGTGLTGQYYDNMDFTALKVTRTDPTVNFDWGAGSPVAGVGADTFTVRWTGQVQPPANGTYTFTTASDDGVRL